MTTQLAQSDREPAEKLKIQHKTLIALEYLKDLLNALPNVVTILNDKRQIVYSNHTLLSQLSIKDFYKLLGKRPGEAIHCIHASECAGGCGTSESCRVCGALQAIRESMRKNRKVTEECRITSNINGSEESFDFEVTASPFTWQGEKFTIFTLSDISNLKRRRILEKIFFHDILNTASNLKGLAEILPQLDDQEKITHLLNLMKYVSEELVEEIEAQKQLSSAEAGELKLRPEPLRTIEIVEIVTNQFLVLPSRKRCEILIDKESDNITFFCDKSLLIRVLKNMLKNAIEASGANDPIIFGVRVREGSIIFRIHNTSFIPRDIQLQVFNRNFSTKGADRGLGTYSMRLFGEKYLDGRVYFESAEDNGTTFFYELPSERRF